MYIVVIIFVVLLNRFVENVVTSERKSESPMLYHIPAVKSSASMLKHCTEVDQLVY